MRMSKMPKLLKEVGQLVLLLLLPAIGLAQHQEMHEHPNKMWKGGILDTTGNKQLLTIFKLGTLHGHFRYYFAMTNNTGVLTDYYGNAIGGGLRFETAKFHGFQFAVSGFYIFNIGSSDFTKSDSITGGGSRYELGLFDVEDPSNKYDMDRLEELYLKYSFRNSNIVVGRQLVNTPFINLQDGRMRPTGVEGVYLNVQEWERLSFEGGFMWSFSPRSTVEWFNAGESIGVYSSGRNFDGSESQYEHHVQSKGVAMLGVHATPTNWLKLHVWDFWIENVQNTAFIQADMDWKLPRDNHSIIGGLQFTRQDALVNGGNDNPEFSYTHNGARSMVVGGRLGWTNNHLTATVSYNHITKDGRFLHPREWGREPFFTYLSRERSEGAGNVHAAVAEVGYEVPKTKLRLSLAGGHVWMPDPLNARLNKYGLPSYAQVNFDVKYDFHGFLKGLDVHMLLVGKIRTGNDYDIPEFSFNKVNLFHGDLVVNYHF